MHPVCMFQVYALTKERDTLRREHSRKSDAAALLKEKDEIINQVMAEGELPKKTQKTHNLFFSFLFSLYFLLYSAYNICLSE